MNTISLRNNKVIVKFNYDPGYVSRIASVPSSWFNNIDKTWEVNIEYLDGVLFNFPSFAITSDIKSILNSRSTAIITPDVPKQIKTITLFDHQIQNVKDILKKKKVILADEQGLGKTYSALVAAKLSKLPIHIIAPASLHDMWVKASLNLGIEPYGVISWAKIPYTPEGDFFCILDEAHALQSMLSKRTKDAIAFCDKAEYIVAITGTPIKNGRPINLFGILAAIKHPLSYNKVQYERVYCNAKSTRFTKWDCNGVSNLSDLYKNISPVLIRHKKEDCLDLPAKTRTIREVALSREAFAGFTSVMKKHATEWKDRVRKGIVSSKSEKLVMFNAVRQAASIAKVPEAVSVAEELNENGRQGVFFVAYKATANELKTRIEQETKASCGIVTGDFSIAARNKTISDFQKGLHKFIICTFESGATGITLTASSYITLVDRPWTPGVVLQAEDRVHRISQTNAVTALWLSISKYDEPIDEMLIEKSKNISHILSGDPEMEKINLTEDIDSIFDKIFLNF